MKRQTRLLLTLLLVALAAAALTGSALAATGDATVTASELNMRTGAGLEYEVIDAAPRGSVVTVQNDDGSGWYQVSYNGRAGYMSASYITFDAATAAAQTTAIAPDGAIVQGSYVRLRSGPSVDSTVLDYLHTGTLLTVNGLCGEWYEVSYNGNIGYISCSYLAVGGFAAPGASAAVQAEPAAEQPATEQPAAVQPVATPQPSEPVSSPVILPPSGDAGQRIVDTALQYLGVPYVWAGTSPEEGFDCSGLVYYVYQQCGYSINRVAQTIYYNGVEADMNDLQPGDVLLFGSSVYNIWHTGIYIGNSQFVHAPYSGQVVSIENLDQYYGLRLVAARRIV